MSVLHPSAGLAEYAAALGYAYLAPDERIEPLRRVEGGRDVEGDHLVAFYEDEGFLTASVCDVLLAGLRRGESVLVVATARHRAAFEGSFSAAGHDVAASVRDGRLLVLDAEATLADLLAADDLDRRGLLAAVTALVERADPDGHGVRVYGEMVALLWEAGRHTLALDLEDAWNDLLEHRPFHLVCGYPLAAFASEETAALFHAVCGRHTAVTTESYAQLAPEAGVSQGVVVLDAHEPGGRRVTPGAG
jgi:hypothetical protein